ncbi:MAG TPA: glycoside hydrolase family 15 protein [Candidatus Nanopelagicaceae bacterium]|nr:glycoside hydrolase family 15 protein [Candidatus Nanopelagicaceae bacterium]HVA88652.1 glycoside hydrolase family 15 protein [Chloroflexota bacterium]
MPRDLPISNGRLLVTFDSHFRIRDIYYPHVGSENQTAGHINRLGVWVDGDFAWLDNPAWERTMAYLPGTLVTNVEAKSERLGLSLVCQDCVDFDRPVLLRRFRIRDLLGRARDVRIMLHYDSYLYETEVGDTVCYRPQSRSLIFYKRERYLLAGGSAAVLGEADPDGDADSSPDHSGRIKELSLDGIASWATGTKVIHQSEGTWRDAEDGVLGRNAIAQGSVDGVIALHVALPPGGASTVHHWLCVGRTMREVEDLSREVEERRPEAMIRRTADYWRVWAEKDGRDFGDLSPEVAELYKRSLLIVRTQIDYSGAIIAANDTDVAEVARDHYSYVWPRDGALVAEALDLAGYREAPRRFYVLMSKLVEPEGYLLHKYNPDGSLASSWHPWSDADGNARLPIQEDESALLLYGLWVHYNQSRDVEYLRPLYRKLVRPVADFLVTYREPHTGLPAASHDLWEERYGIHSFTVGTVWAGLEAGARFADLFGEHERAARYRAAASEIREAALRHLWSDEAGSFVRMVTVRRNGVVDRHHVPDSSIYGLIRFGMIDPDDPRAISTMLALRKSLTCKTPIGGVARYSNDYYYQVSSDIENIPGNPWFICTLWMAEYDVMRARAVEDLAPVRATLEWVRARALASGALAEQVHPLTGAPLSVSPLTWSHATLVGLVDRYLVKRRALLSEAEARARHRVFEG